MYKICIYIYIYMYIEKQSCLHRYLPVPSGDVIMSGANRHEGSFQSQVSVQVCSHVSPVQYPYLLGKVRILLGNSIY